MNAITRTLGVIRAVHGSPGPASGITYDVDINIPGVGVIAVNGVIPHNNRPPDDYDSIGAATGSAFDVYIVGGQHQYIITEYPDSAECQA